MKVIGIVSRDNRIETVEFEDIENARIWMHGKMMCLLNDQYSYAGEHPSCCSDCFQLRFECGSVFHVEDDDAYMGEGRIEKNEIAYDPVYGHSFCIKLIEMD